MLVTIQFRRGSAAAWTSANPVLHLGEPGLDTTSMRLKLGDGVTAWEDLEWTTPTPAQMAQLIELLDGVTDLDDVRMTNVLEVEDSDFTVLLAALIPASGNPVGDALKATIEDATALLAPRADADLTGNTSVERLGMGEGVPTSVNRVYKQFRYTAADAELLAPTGDVVAEQTNVIHIGDRHVRGTVTVTATGGSSVWTIGGQSATIPWNASAATVQTALRALSSVGPGAFGYSYIDVTGGPGGGAPYVVTYSPRFLNDQNFSTRKLTINGAGLTGPSAGAAITWANLGGADTGYVWLANDYLVTGTASGDGDGLGKLFGRLSEVAIRSDATIGGITGIQGEVSFSNASGTGHVGAMYGIRTSTGRHKDGANPAFGTADQVYGYFGEAARRGRTVVDAVTTSGSPTVTSADGFFMAGEKNHVVTGTGIPADTYIASVAADHLSVTLSNNCTASGTITMTIKGKAQAGNAFIFNMYLDEGPVRFNGPVEIKPDGTDAVLNATLLPVATWTAATIVPAYQLVKLPTGGLGYVTTFRRTRASWDATERDLWTFLPGGHVEVLSSGTSWKAPVGIAQIETLDLLGGGAGGAGGGSATAAINQSGGGGGACGERTVFRGLAITPGTSYNYGIGTAGTGGSGGAAAGTNPGTAGVKGGDTLFTISGVGYRAGGGNVAAAPSGGSTVTTTVGAAGGAAWTASYVMAPGQGGSSGGGFGSPPAPLDGAIGGGGGGTGNGTLGGGGGNARTSVGGSVASVSAGASGTSSGVNGTTATQPGCGGGGGGGGCNGGAGGNGGAGAAGLITLEF